MGDLATGGFQQLLVIDPRELEEAERVIAAVRSSQTVVPSYPDGIKAAGAGLSTGPQAAGPPSRHRLGAGLGWAQPSPWLRSHCSCTVGGWAGARAVELPTSSEPRQLWMRLRSSG